MKIRYPKTSFYGGLLNPAAEGKIENALLNAALRKADNCILDKNGNIASADGTKLAAELNTLTGQSGPFAKVEFKVSNDLMYCLIFGNYTMYIKKNGTFLYSGNTLYSVPTCYKADDLFDENGICNFKYAQSADVLYLAHKDYALQILKRKSDLDWSFSSLKGGKGPWSELNDDKTKHITSNGAANDVVVLNSVNGAGIETDLVFEPVDWGYLLVDVKIYVYINNVQVNMVDFGQKTPGYLATDDAAVVLNAVPGIVAVKTDNYTLHITDTTSSRGGQQVRVRVWYDPWNYGDPDGLEQNFYATFSQTSSINLFEESWVGRYIRIFQPPLALVQVWRTGKSVNLNDYILYGNNYYKAGNAGTTGELPPTHTEGVRSDGAVSWQYINSGYAVGQIVEFVSANEIKIKVNDGNMPVSLNSSAGTYLWQLDLEDKKPQAVEFFKDRLFLAYNNRLTASKTGDYENFDDLEYGEQLPTCGLNFVLQLPLNKICWLKALNDILYLGTQANIIAVKALNNGDVLGPNNISYEIISYTGASEIQPIVLDSILMFIAKGRNKIISVQYNFQTNSYVPQELTVNNDFFLKDTVVSWALSYTPDKTVYAVIGSGEVLALKLLSAEFLSLVKFKTDKRFKQVISLFDGNLNKDLAEFICLNSQKYLDETQGDNPLELALNCTLNFTGSVVSGAQVPLFLRGKNLFLIVNGQDYGPFNNAGEVIDLSGLGITADSTNYTAELGVFNKNIIEFMPVCGAAQSSKIAGATGQKITAVIARVWQSRQFKFGLNLRELWPAVKLSTQEPFNGDVVLDAGGSTTYPFADENGPVNSTGARFFIVQDRPAEFTICGLFYDISISES